MSVDYKGGEHSKHVIRSFVTPLVRFISFLFYKVEKSLGSFFVEDYMIFYFSGTGNSAWVAKKLAESTDDICVSIEEKKLPCIIDLKKEERLGFVFPVYAWSAPERIMHFIRRLQTVVAPSYLYFVCTCGDDAGKTADILLRLFRKKQWVCHAGYSLTMPNTYVALPGFDVDTEEIANEKLSKAKERIEVIARQIYTKNKGFEIHEGSFPRLKSYVLRPLFNKFLMSPRRFKWEKTCISCGKCAKVCPRHNIEMKNSRPVWGNDCSMCLACYHHCPRHAVAYACWTQKKGQYVLPPTMTKEAEE